MKNSGIVRIWCEAMDNPNNKFSVVLVVPGDVTQDGLVDMDDADVCGESALGDKILTAIQQLLADLNLDGTVDFLDVDIIGELALEDKEI